MTLIEDILTHNRDFVERKEYEAYRTDRFPSKKMAVLTCMDTRLVELLPKAMNLGQGEIKLIKAAGAVVSHPFGSVMRSILVAVYELNAREVAVVGHHDCGMMGLDCASILEKAKRRGIHEDVLHTLKSAGIDLDQWLTGFRDPEAGVHSSLQMIRNHPLLPRDVPVHGLMIHPETGRLEVVSDGYEQLAARP